MTPLLVALALLLAVLLVGAGCWLLCAGAGRVSDTAFDDEDRRGDGRREAAGTNDQRS